MLRGYPAVMLYNLTLRPIQAPRLLFGWVLLTVTSACFRSEAPGRKATTRWNEAQCCWRVPRFNSAIGINDGSESKIGRQHVKTAMRRIGIDALSPSAHHQTRARPQDPSISAARHGDYATEPSLGDGNHLHSDGAWLRRSRCGVGLHSTSRSVVATVDHHKTAFCVERWRIPWLVPASRTSSTRLRLSVHWTGFYRRARRQRSCDQHGRNGAWRDNVFVERLWSNVKHEEMCPL